MVPLDSNSHSASTELSQPRQTSVRAIYAKRMSKERLDALKAEMSDEDRYELATELAIYRDHLATLISMETKIREKHPGRDDLVLALQQQQISVIDGLARTAKVVREIENAGSVYTEEKLGALLDKVASVVAYHVSDERERMSVIAEINDLAMIFRRGDANGTLLTPDRDAEMMDSTVPGPPVLGQPLPQERV